MNRRFLDDLSLAMADVYASVTDEILVNLARHFRFIAQGKAVPGAWEYQVRKLAEVGQVNQETVSIILSRLGDADDTLRGLLEESIINGLEGAEHALRKAAQKGLLKTPSSPTLAPNQMQAFMAYYEQSADKLNLVNTVMLESTQQAYTATVADIVSRIENTQGILNVATGEIVTGVDSFNKVLHDSVRKMVANNLTGFIDHGGHHWSPEAYVAMDMRTTMTNTARAAIRERSEEFGCDLYQVSSHNGARPLCYPWQGKVISTTGWTGEVEDLDGNKVTVHSESEIESFRYGGGLFGVNCGHYPIPFIPGFSVSRPPEQDEEANAKEYAESQEQRRLERELRAERRELSVMKAQGATEEEIRAQRQRVTNARNDLDSFCDQTGRARRKEREYTPINATWPDDYKQTKWEQGIKRRDPTPKVQQTIPNVPNVPQTTPEQPVIAPATNQFVTETLANSGIKTVELTRWAQTPTEDQIISAIGGGDLTSGSCSSVAFAFAGNEAGFDVHDFRGGDSRSMFSWNINIRKVANFDGVTSFSVIDKNDVRGANEVLKNVKADKKYYLRTGKHAAIVRKNGDDIQYLELQSTYRNGWHTLTNDQLRFRFGCRSRAGSYELENNLIDIETLGKSPDFIEMLKYINTAVGEQMKGVSGGIK